MRVNLCCTHTFVPEQFLDCADIVTGFEQVCGEAVAESVAAGMLWDPCFSDGEFNSVLQTFGRNMMPAFLSGTWIDGMFGGGEDILPFLGA